MKNIKIICFLLSSIILCSWSYSADSTLYYQFDRSGRCFAASIITLGFCDKCDSIGNIKALSENDLNFRIQVDSKKYQKANKFLKYIYRTKNSQLGLEGLAKEMKINIEDVNFQNIEWKDYIPHYKLNLNADLPKTMNPFDMLEQINSFELLGYYNNRPFIHISVKPQENNADNPYSYNVGLFSKTLDNNDFLKDVFFNKANGKLIKIEGIYSRYAFVKNNNLFIYQQGVFQDKIKKDGCRKFLDKKECINLLKSRIYEFRHIKYQKEKIILK